MVTDIWSLPSKSRSKATVLNEFLATQAQKEEKKLLFQLRVERLNTYYFRCPAHSVYDSGQFPAIRQALLPAISRLQNQCSMHDTGPSWTKKKQTRY